MVSESRPLPTLLMVALMATGCFPGIEAEPAEPGPVVPAPDPRNTPPPPSPECLLDTDCPQDVANLCAARTRCLGNQCKVDPATEIQCLETNDPCIQVTCDPPTGSCVSEDVCVCEPRATPLTCGESVTLSRFDAGTSFVLSEYPCLAGVDTTGPEHTYLFTPEKTEAVQFKVNSGEIAGLFVLHNGAQGCEAGLCVAGGPGGAAFVATAGITYAVVVEHLPEGSDAAPVGFTLECGVVGEADCGNGVDDDSNGVTDCDDQLCIGVQGCPTQVETQCGDEVDDDGDGLVDCDDLDCSQTGVCLEGCIPSLTADVLCGFSQELGTGGGSALATNYECGFGEPAAPGNEVVYPFSVSEFRFVTVSISAGVGAGLYLLQDTGKGCTPKDCLQYGLNQVQFTASPGVSYYLVVDSVVDTSVTFAINVSCL